MGLNFASFWPQAIRCIRREGRTLFLTFDDGPDPESTPQVLDALARHNVKATFFLIAAKARRQPELLDRLRSEGHAIGNHSLDHRYSAFFSGRTRMLKWIDESEAAFRDLGVSTVGFRPPAGVITPELGWALRKNSIPLILWEKRFFDGVFAWTRRRAERSLQDTRPGSLVLLHDRQPVHRVQAFTDVLSAYIEGAKTLGFEFGVLTREMCQSQISPHP